MALTKHRHKSVTEFFVSLSRAINCNAQHKAIIVLNRLNQQISCTISTETIVVDELH